MLDIKKTPSPNRYNGRNGWKPDMICNHITQGRMPGCLSWLRNPASQASANFLIARNGTIYELVDIRDAAWCNGTTPQPNKRYYNGRSLLSTVRERNTNANYYTVSIEHEGMSGEPLTEEQYQSSLWLHKHITIEVKTLYDVDILVDREHIVGHYQIAPKEKPICPGDAFPWDRLMRDLARWKKERNKGGNDVQTVKVLYKGKRISLRGYVKDGRNYVQIREAFEKTGHTVDWDNTTKTVIIK